MKSIKVTILGRRYPLRVKESEVETTHKIARYVNERMKKYREELPQQALTTVMVMAAMSLAEEALETGSEKQSEGDISEKIEQINSQLEDMLDDIQQEKIQYQIEESADTNPEKENSPNEEPGEESSNP